jgi:hypothetical protein
MNNSKNADDSASALQESLERELRAYRARNYAIAMGFDFKSDSELQVRRIDSIYPRSALSRCLKLRRGFREKLSAR